MADNTRMRVLVAVESASAPQTIEEIADITGLHANTVRNHLEVLVAMEAVQREPLPASGRGRPRFAYRPAQTATPYENLASVLMEQLADVSTDESTVRTAAERWAGFAESGPSVDSPDAAVDTTVQALNRLGFTATPSDVGDAIVLHTCPYADLAERNPIICDIHAALISRLLESTHQPVSLHAVEIEPRPGMCVVRLDRPDLAPHRVIEPESPQKAAT